MFQKGTGERFKYKEEVLKVFPDAKCYKHLAMGICFYYVDVNGRKIANKSAEGAWADCWAELISPQTKNK